MLLISFQPSVRLRSSVEDFEKGIEPYTKVTTVQLLNLPGCILLQGYHQFSTVKRKQTDRQTNKQTNKHNSQKIIDPGW